MNKLYASYVVVVATVGRLVGTEKFPKHLSFLFFSKSFSDLYLNLDSSLSLLTFYEIKNRSNVSRVKGKVKPFEEGSLENYGIAC